MDNEMQTEYVEHLREEYSEHKRDKLDELRDLDRKVKLPADIFVYSFGIIGALILGVGMCLAMGAIGGSLSYAFTLGIIIGCVGLVWVMANYFIYKAIMKSRKKKYSEQIIALSDDILKK